MDRSLIQVKTGRSCIATGCETGIGTVKMAPRKIARIASGHRPPACGRKFPLDMPARGNRQAPSRIGWQVVASAAPHGECDAFARNGGSVRCAGWLTAGLSAEFSTAATTTNAVKRSFHR